MASVSEAQASPAARRSGTKRWTNSVELVAEDGRSADAPYPQPNLERACRCATRGSRRERRANFAACSLRCES